MTEELLATIEQLKEENKKLKADYIKLSKIVEINGGYRASYVNELRDKITMLEEENKKLNIKVASLEGEIKGLNSVIDKLKEENQTLELWLDNKEKVNKKLREELSAYDREYFDEDKKAENIFTEESTLQ